MRKKETNGRRPGRRKDLLMARSLVRRINGQGRGRKRKLSRRVRRRMNSREKAKEMGLLEAGQWIRRIGRRGGRQKSEENDQEEHTTR
jgi:hypothetical protein